MRDIDAADWYAIQAMHCTSLEQLEALGQRTAADLERYETFRGCRQELREIFATRMEQLGGSAD